MAIWLNPDTGEFSSDGTWTSTSHYCCEVEPVEYVGQDQLEEPNPDHIDESEVA